MRCSSEQPSRSRDVTAADRRPRADRVAHPAAPLRPVGAVRLAARRRARRGRPRRDAVRHRRLDHHRRRCAAPPRTDGPRTTTIDPKVAECTPHRRRLRARRRVRHHPQRLRLPPADLQRRWSTRRSSRPIHGFSSPRIVPVYERYDATTTYVAISDADRHPRCTTPPRSTTASTPTPSPSHPHPGDHLLFFGRIHPDKGTADAIEVARRAERRLVIAGIIQDQQYFDERGRTAPRRRPGALHRPGGGAAIAPRCSAAPMPSSTSSTSTSRSATASSRRWRAARPVIAHDRGSMPRADHRP